MTVAQEIGRAVEQIPGFVPFDELLVLYSLAVAAGTENGDLVEIGSFCGRSAVVLGMAARDSGGGRVWCIDLFPEAKDWVEQPDGSRRLRTEVDGHLVEAHSAHPFWKAPFEQHMSSLYAKHSSAREVFDAAVKDFGLDRWIRAFRGTSELFGRSAESQGLRCRLAFVDGDHDREAVGVDITNVEKWLVPGGWVCFDDAFSGYSGVDAAISERVVGNPRYSVQAQLTRKLYAARQSGVRT